MFGKNMFVYCWYSDMGKTFDIQRVKDCPVPPKSNFIYTCKYISKYMYIYVCLVYICIIHPKLGFKQ